MSSSRARWTPGVEKGLVDLLHEYSDLRWRGQNGWTTQGWNHITSEFNKKYFNLHFTKAQIKEHERELKASYTLIKELQNKSGVSWDSIRFMISASDEIWKELIQENPKVKKWQSKAFPLFDLLALLYEGSTAECRKNSTLVQHNSIEAGNIEQDELAEEPHFTMAPPASSPTATSSQAPARHQTPEYSSPLEMAGKKSKPNSDRTGDTVDRYMERRKAKFEKEQQLWINQDDYSIPRCIDIVNNMEEFTEDEVVMVSEAFHDLSNREVFLSLAPRFRHSWMRRQIAKLT